MYILLVEPWFFCKYMRTRIYIYIHMHTWMLDVWMAWALILNIGDSLSILCVFIVRWCWVDRHLGMDISMQKPFWFCWTIWVYLGHLRDMETGKMKFIKVSKSFGSFWRCFWYVSFPRISRIIHFNGIFHYKPSIWEYLIYGTPYFALIGKASSLPNGGALLGWRRVWLGFSGEGGAIDFYKTKGPVGLVINGEYL